MKERIRGGRESKGKRGKEERREGSFLKWQDFRGDIMLHELAWIAFIKERGEKMIQRLARVSKVNHNLVRRENVARTSEG